MEGYRYLSFEKMDAFCREVFQKLGMSEKDSASIAEVLLESDLMGIESHGLQRLIMYYGGIQVGRIDPKAQIRVVRETPVSALIDGDDGFGHVAGKMAMQMAIDKAKQSGIGLVLVKNSTHYGIAGYYSMMAAKQGVLGMSMTNTEALVVPTFGKTPMVGTNPIAVTMPAKPYPFHVDMATSVVPAGKMEVYNKKGLSVPEGWIVNSEGAVTTDPGEFIEIRKNKTDGGLLPLGGEGELHSGHKGYALGVIVELLTAVLGGGHTSNHVRAVPTVEKCCHMFLAVDYEIFGDKEEIEQGMSTYMDELRNSNKAAGHYLIYTHGEKELSNYENVRKNGVKVNQKTYEELLDICRTLGADEAYYFG